MQQEGASAPRDVRLCLAEKRYFAVLAAKSAL
jgi:hypothetical protein